MKRYTLLLGMSFFFAAGFAATAADLSVESGSLRAVYNETARSLGLFAGPSPKPFATVADFAPAGAAVRAVRVKGTLFEKGEALEVSRPDGSRDQVILSPSQPFAFFRTILKNGASQAVTNRVAYPALALDLGLASDALSTLGTGGLLKPDKNPGSYMWAAVADPATRRGVVAGWVSTDRGSGIVRLAVTNGAVCLLPHADYGRLLLALGQTETLETFAIGLFDDARLGLEAYGDALAKNLDVRLPPMPTVHCT